ncbi:MAG: ABC transporter ATP-binding protein [Clostridia bacterium]|nr:ABC transporter ATP-binding protein [Clostridia bacterium]
MEKGRIMGLIGRNGAGKTTTLKSVFNLVHPDGGEVRIFGLEMPKEDREIKQRIGYAGGAVDFYSRKKLSQIVEVTKQFYGNWDDDACRKYLDAFSLDANKTPKELSEGMRVKCSLTLALSHRAELLDVLLFLKEKGVSILFSTHITTDLEKCADDITYIAGGKVIASQPLSSFMTENAAAGRGRTLEEIMVNCEKESLYEKLAD